jgi:hypothetical protein
VEVEDRHFGSTGCQRLGETASKFTCAAGYQYDATGDIEEGFRSEFGGDVGYSRSESARVSSACKGVRSLRPTRLSSS